MKSMLIDLTVTFSRLMKEWTSRYPAIHFSLSATNTDVLPKLVRAHASDFKEYHMSTKTMASRMQNAAWQARFNDKHVVLIFDYYSEFMKKFVPSYLMTGRPLILVHAGYKDVHTLQCPPTEDMSDVFDTVSSYLDELNFKWAESEGRRLCSEEQCRANLTYEAAAAAEDSAYAKRGPITVGSVIRKHIAISTEDMLSYITEVAPLYDMDVPSLFFSLPQYENMKQYNPDPTMAKFLRPTRTVMSPHYRQVFLECPAAVETVYYQVKWYQDHDIQPDYVWHESKDRYGDLHRRPMLPQEAADLCTDYILNEGEGTPALQALFA